MEQTLQVVALLDDVFGPDLIGAYLHGSSVLGGLKPASDVDVLVVARRPMDETQCRVLLRGLLGISGSRNQARPVELVVVDQSEVRPWRYPPSAEFLYGEWQREAYEAGDVPRAQPMPDLVLLTLARIWSTLSTGQIWSKDVAADWAISGLPPEHRPALSHARDLYLNCPYSHESWSDALRAQVHPCVDRLLAEIGRRAQDHGLPPLSR